MVRKQGTAVIMMQTTLQRQTVRSERKQKTKGFEGDTWVSWTMEAKLYANGGTLFLFASDKP